MKATQETYATIMSTTRRRRKCFFSVILAYIPALIVTRAFSPTDRAMGTIFIIWLLVLIPSAFLVAVSRCPRCGNYFHVNGPTLLILRRCLHCQLHISSDTPPAGTADSQP